MNTTGVVFNTPAHPFLGITQILTEDLPRIRPISILIILLRTVSDYDQNSQVPVPYMTYSVHFIVILTVTKMAATLSTAFVT